MQHIQEQKAIIKAELAEIKETIQEYENNVEEGLTLIANTPLIKEKIKEQVQILIANNSDREPVLITLLDGGFFITSLVLAELQAHNEIAMRNRCVLLKMPSDINESDIYAHIAAINAPNCLVFFNEILYLANKQQPFLTAIDQEGIEPLLALFSKPSMPIGVPKQASKKTHNLVASLTSMPKDTYFVYQHTSMRTKSYEGTELREVTISSPPNCSVVDEHVIVIDDVFDSGLTYDTVFKYLMVYEATTVELMVLINKDILHTERTHTPQYECLTSSKLIETTNGEKPTEPFLVGGGMDYLSKRFRELPGIYGVDFNTLPPVEIVNALLLRQKTLQKSLDSTIQMTKMNLNQSLPRKLLQDIIQYPNQRLEEEGGRLLEEVATHVREDASLLMQNHK